MSYFSLLKHFIFLLKPETAHDAAIFCLKHNLIPTQKFYNPDILSTEIAGIKFPNIVGLAAGFDKNADCIDCLSKQGFGFVETGTVTPKAQPGNPKPRIFRLNKDHAIVNALGFNNKGSQYYISNLKKSNSSSIIGTNIGKNKSTKNAIDDYLYLFQQVYQYCNYVTVNISSPNTKGLRDLQNKQELNTLLKALSDVRADLDAKKPIFLKISPDINKQQNKDIVESVLKHNINGIIISNTTISRKANLKSSFIPNAGGLSGSPLFETSTNILKQSYIISEGKIPLIGVGGIASGQDALIKIKAGASLIQLYSALIYNGFSLVNKIKYELATLVKQEGYTNISEVVGSSCVF